MNFCLFLSTFNSNFSNICFILHFHFLFFSYITISIYNLIFYFEFILFCIFLKLIINSYFWIFIFYFEFKFLIYFNQYLKTLIFFNLINVFKYIAHISYSFLIFMNMLLFHQNLYF